MFSTIGYVIYSAIFAYLVYSYRCFKITLRNRRKVFIRNKVVVITGASSGIGEALAHEFFANGCKVVLAARRLQELMRVKQELMAKKLPEPSPEPVVMQLDLGNLDDCAQFVQKVHRTCGSVDILINNGGIGHCGTNAKTKFEIHQKVMNVNYFGAVVLTNGFLPLMQNKMSGQIVMVSSVLGRMAVGLRAPYCASKHAMIAYADSLRAEVYKYDITVTVLIPGMVKTAISSKAINGETGEAIGKLEAGAESGYSPEYVAQRFMDMILDYEQESVLCQPKLRFGMFMRRAMPSVFFFLSNNRII